MIIKNNNKAVDVLKNQHVCWEGQKTSRRFYVKKTISYGKWSTHKLPETIPSISWEGGTTVNCKCWVERTNKVREGFVISTVTEKHYLIPSFSGIASDCRVNTTGNNEDGFTFTFGRRDNATSDRTYTGVVQYTDESGSYSITVTITQTKRDKYVTKLDNASITTNLIPASGGNISSGTLTFRKTYNTGETENVSEHVTFSTVSATTKGTTESPVTDVKTIPAGGTTQKQTTIDGVTLTHPSFTVKQAANTKTIKTPESKTTTSVILSVSPTVVYSSGGTVTFTLLRMYTLNKTLYLYTSGSTSGGGSDANQGPEAVNANLTYTITGITGVSSTKGTSYKIPASTSARTIKFKTTYDGITSNEASVSLKLDGPNESKAFIYSNLKITEYSYTKDNSGYHFPASGKTITATDCTLKGTYDWTYTSMENKTVTETVTWTFNDLTAAMYTFTPTSFTADSLGTTSKAADILYKNFTVNIKNLKHTYNGKLHDVKDSNGRFLTASKTVTLTRLGNSGTQASNPTSTNLSVSVSPTSFDYKGGSATLTATLIKIFNVTWTSGATSTNPTNTDVTSSTTFSGTYREYGQTQQNTFSFTGNKPTIPNILSSKTSRTYTFTGTYGSYSDTATVSQTGNTTLFTVTWNLNGGNINGDTTNKTESVESGSTVSFTKYTPVKTGYTFNGWATSSTATSGSKTGNSAAITADTTFYATWKSATLTPILLILADDAPLTEPVIGSILYSTNDNKLTLNALTNGKDNTAIAICVIPEVLENFENGDNSDGAVKTARFVSINYMNYNTPATGSKEAQSMYFGNYGTEIGNTMGGTVEASYVGGKWNTKRCVFKATNQDKTSDKVENKSDAGYCAPACCCERYSTPGTKQGDWYLPSVGELYQIYANKAAINEKRTAIKGSGFYDGGYWSSFEYSGNYEYYVNLNNGTIRYNNKNYSAYVLGFLAVEVSQLVN